MKKEILEEITHSIEYSTDYLYLEELRVRMGTKERVKHKDLWSIMFIGEDEQFIKIDSLKENFDLKENLDIVPFNSIERCLYSLGGYIYDSKHTQESSSTNEQIEEFINNFTTGTLKIIYIEDITSINEGVLTFFKTIFDSHEIFYKDTRIYLSKWLFNIAIYPRRKIDEGYRLDPAIKVLFRIVKN